MKVLVTGVNGQLGHDVILELVRRGHKAVGSGSGETYCGKDTVTDQPYIQLNITDQSAVEKTIGTIQPDAVIHCSAWTAVDAAEEPNNQEKVFELNVRGPEYIAKACNAIRAKLVYLSTDYVFDGHGTQPWKPDDTNFAPLNYYGQSKLEGEFAVLQYCKKFFIVRSSWIFGLNGQNFVKTMINIGKKNNTVRVVNDQIGTPTYTKDLSRLLVDLIETEKYGCYHVTNEGGYISWYDFCCEIYRQYGLKTEVIPVTTHEYGHSKAARPYNSRLDKSKLVLLGFEQLPAWQDALKRYLEEAQL